MSVGDFINWLRYKLHLTDWKKEKTVITYWTCRGYEGDVIPTEFKVVPRNPMNQEIWVDSISFMEKAVSVKEIGR